MSGYKGIGSWEWNWVFRNINQWNKVGGWESKSHESRLWICKWVEKDYRRSNNQKQNNVIIHGIPEGEENSKIWTIRPPVFRISFEYGECGSGTRPSHATNIPCSSWWPAQPTTKTHPRKAATLHWSQVNPEEEPDINKCSNPRPKGGNPRRYSPRYQKWTQTADDESQAIKRCK